MAAHHNTHRPDHPSRSGESPVRPEASGEPPLSPRTVDMPVLLAHWRSKEVFIAKQFRACGGASLADVEELYDDTVAALIEKGDSYESAEHLRRALHRGIKLRGFRLHRDSRSRTRTLEHSAPALDGAAREQAWRVDPSRALIAREDDILIGEFVAELTPLERQVFALVADGRSWRAVATALGVSEPEGRRLTRSCERKRERFLGLYSTGRLCGYRSATIASLLAGRARSELAFGKALAHLRHCAACRARHKIDAPQLVASFDARVLSVLPPMPVLVEGHASLLEHMHGVLARFARLFQRSPAAGPGGRERAFEALAGSGAAAKAAVGLATLALVAGGAVGVSSRAAPRRSAHRHHHAALPVRLPSSPPRAVRTAPHRTAPPHHSHRLPSPSEQHTPGGFSYLGVPPHATSQPPSAPAVHQSGGTPFSP